MEKCFISPEDIREIIDKVSNTADWLEKCTDATEDIDEGIPEPRVRPISTIEYFDFYHSHGWVMGKSVSDVMCFVGSTPMSWSRKMEGVIHLHIILCRPSSDIRSDFREVYVEVFRHPCERSHGPLGGKLRNDYI